MQIYSILYRILLVCFIVLQFIARFLVGMAGHNPPTTTSEYVVMGMVVLTFIILTVQARTDKPTIKIPAKYLSLALVGAGAIALGYMLATLFADEDFDFVLFLIGAVFLLLSVAVCRELLRKD